MVPSSNNVYYKTIEIRVGNHPALLHVGDYVLLHSGSTDNEEDLYDAVMPLKVRGENVTVASRSTLGSKGKSRENVSMNALNPYIGQIENFW